MFYDEGYDAYVTGLSLEQNPYKIGSHEANEWEEGWHQAYRDDNPED